MILLIIFFVLLAALVLSIFYYYKWKKKQKKEKETQIYQEEKAPSMVYRIIYRGLSSWALTRGSVARVRKRYEMVEPGDIERLEKDTVTSLLRVFGISLILLILAFIFGVSLYIALLVVFTIYIACSEYLEKSVKAKKSKILHQMKGELENLQNNYNRIFDVSEALYETAVNAPEPLRSHLKIIWDILQSDYDTMNQRIEEYNISAPNAYLKDLLSCSREVSKYDDSKVDGISNYIRKLTVIINAVAIEERKEDDLRQSFSGHAAVCIFPVYLAPILVNVAGVFNQINQFMSGTYGIISTILCFVVSFVCYTYIVHKKNMDYVCATSHPFLQKLADFKPVKVFTLFLQNCFPVSCRKVERQLHKIGESMTVDQFLVERILFCILSFVLCLITCGFIQINTKNMALKDNSGVDAFLLEGTTEEEEGDICDYLTDLSYKAAGGSYNQATILEELKKNTFFNTEEKQTLALEDILQRLDRYQHAYFKWYYILISLIIAAICSFIPYFFIAKNEELVKMKADDEVMRFQNIISCMKNIKRASTKEILEEMELSASIFRNSLTECVDEYAADPMLALNNFMERERDTDLLQRITIKFIRADQVGVHDAFANLEEEIYEAHKVREQKNHNYIQNGSTLTFLLAFIPVFTVIFLEMVIPMLLSTMQQMTFMNTF